MFAGKDGDPCTVKSEKNLLQIWVTRMERRNSKKTYRKKDSNGDCNTEDITLMISQMMVMG